MAMPGSGAEPDPAEGPVCAPGYTWTQTQSTVTIAFEVPVTVTVMNIMVTFEATQLVAGVEGLVPQVCGTLHQQVTESECTWEREMKQDYALVVIRLQKSVAIDWQVPIKSGRAQDGYIDPQSEYELAKYFIKSSNIPRALEHLNAAADAQLIQARLHLGNLYYFGHRGRYPVQCDLRKAILNFKLAADMGSGEAMFLLGTIYNYGGDGVDVDISKAIHYYELCATDEQAAIDDIITQRGKSLNNHRSTGLFNLGIIYNYRNQAEDHGKCNQSLAAWEKAADLGHAHAMYNLGVVYLKGIGVPSDSDKALEYFTRANRNNPSLLVPDFGHHDANTPSSPVPNPRSSDTDSPSPTSFEKEFDDTNANENVKYIPEHGFSHTVLGFSVAVILVGVLLINRY